jgi:FAD dependent oxidoreductase
MRENWYSDEAKTRISIAIYFYWKILYVHLLLSTQSPRILLHPKLSPLKSTRTLIMKYTATKRIPLPPPTNAVDVSSQSCQEIIDAATRVSDELRDGCVTGKRATYLPVTDGGVRSEPLIGYTGVEGLVLAARHSCWGIQNAPAAGKVMSKVSLDGVVSCANVGNLDRYRGPGRDASMVRGMVRSHGYRTAVTGEG